MNGGRGTCPATEGIETCRAAGRSSRTPRPVVGLAPLLRGLKLVGDMSIQRHRFSESSWDLPRY